MWETLARYCQSVYGVSIDWTERYFICVECGEPIYEEDWSSDELLELGGHCPICGADWYENEEEEDD